MGEVVVTIASVAVISAFAWLHGYGRGVESMRRQVVRSLRFGASLRTTIGASSDVARALTEAADRFERGGTP